MSPDFNGRKKLVTIHLPIEMGVFIAIQEALAPLIPGDTPFGSVVDSDAERVIFYEPAALGESGSETE